MIRERPPQPSRRAAHVTPFATWGQDCSCVKQPSNETAGAEGFMAPGPMRLTLGHPATIGPETIANLARHGAQMLVIEAGKTMLVDRDAILAAAVREGVVIDCRSQT